MKTAAVASVTSVAVGARCNAQLGGDQQDHLCLGAVQRQQAAATAGGHAARRDQHKILGNWLMSVHGRVYAGMCIKLVKQSSHHGNRYALVEVKQENIA